MPKKDDAPEYAVCDGCGMERDDVDRVGSLMLCESCENHHAADPVVTIHGRSLHYSELKAQAEDDEHLAAALGGDTVQSQVEASRR